MAFYHINGLSIAVIHDNKIAWAKGYGWADSADQKPVNAKTLFQAASISKSLNAVGLLTLVQDKKLDLNTDINQYLTSWKFPDDSISKNKKINVANLLSHTAGLTVHGFAGYAKKDSLPTIIQVLNGEKPANSAPIRSQAVPGIQSVYSGGGITISQQILTDLTHEPYDHYMWNHVLQPMGMLNSSYTQPPSAKAQPELATGYRATGKEIEGKYHIYPEQAAAGLWTNPTDLANYIIETNLSYDGKSSKVLSQANTKLRLTPYIDTAAALGVFISKAGGDIYFSHGGANEGFRSQYYGNVNTGDGVVVMVNSDNGGILNEVINSVAKVYHWKDFYKPVKKTVIQMPTATLQPYLGSYVLDGDTLTIKQQNGQLALEAGDGPWKIHFTSPTDFFVYEVTRPLHFTIDAANKVNAMTIEGVSGVAKKKSNDRYPLKPSANNSKVLLPQKRDLGSEMITMTTWQMCLLADRLLN